MIEWESTDTGIRVVDTVGNELTLGLAAWREHPIQEPMSRPTDIELLLDTDTLVLPGGAVQVVDLATGDVHATAASQTPRTYDAGPYLCVLPGSIQAYVRLHGPVTVTVDDASDETRFELSNRTDVHLGFRSAVSAPAETVTVPRTTTGVARAISVASSAHRTISPDRSFWSMRRHPPAIEFGDTVDIPDTVADAVPETGIELHLPDSLDALFLGAPLAYYLGADVVLDDHTEGRLVAPDAGVDEPLGPDLVETIPTVLARTFWLDCLARNGGPHAEPALVEHDLLTDIGIDHETAYEATPADRLAMYLDAPYERVADDLPEWPLAMHVDPVMAHVSTLPFLINHLSFIYPPETAELEGSELVARSLDDFYRGPPGPIASVEMLKPKLRRGRIHGWLADGTPIDVFKTLPEAYENYLSYLGGGDQDAMSVVVVLNDRDMTGEHERVAEIYQERATDARMDVRLAEELTCDELAALFAESHDFLHYIGHCEVDGLRCADGNLSMADLDETNVQTFFLNACGSYYEGLDLVRKGAIAGAVTFRKVLDEQAAKVGTAFAHLLTSGFPIETALKLSRRRIMMGKDYAVVGNGMQTIAAGTGPGTSVAYLDRRDDGAFEVSWDLYATEAHGAYYRVSDSEDLRPRLSGNRTTFSLHEDELAPFFEDEALPIILDGEFYWSQEIVDRFRHTD